MAAAAQLGVEASAANLAVPGITSDALLTMVRTGDRASTLRQAGIEPSSQPAYDVRATIAAADVVLIEIGANDILQLCAGGGVDCAATTANATANMAVVLDEVTALQGQHAHVVRVLGYYDFCRFPGEAGQSSDARMCGDYLAALNMANRDVAAAKGMQFVDLVQTFNGADGTQDPGPLLSNDHVHPSESGHQLIADLLAALGWDLTRP